MAAGVISSDRSPPTETSPLLGSNGHTGDGTSGASISTEDGTRKPNNDGLEDDSLERQQDDQAPAPGQGLPEVRKRMKYIFPAIAVGVYMVAADQTLIVSSYGTIGSELHALNMTSWIATAYFMTLTSFQPLFGKISDIFGRKVCILGGYLLFGLGCVLCGLAQTMPQLIAARTIAGIGGAATNVVVVILFSDVVPLRERGTWQGYLNIVFSAGSASGAPLGGLLADSIGWRWAFLAQGPLCLLAFFAVGWTLQLPKQDDSNWKAKIRRIDFLGAVTLIAAVFLLLLALDRGSNVGWKTTVAIVSISVSAVLFPTFIFVEKKIAKEPFAPTRIIFPRNMLAPYLCNFFSMAAYFAAMFYVPLYWQAAEGLSATQAGVRLIPPIILTVIGSLGSGIYMQKTGKFQLLTLIAYTLLFLGSLLLLFSTGLLRLLPPNPTFTLLGLIISGLGNGIGVTCTLIALLAHTPRADQAVATACSYLFRSLGSTCGVALAATATNRILRGELDKVLPKLGFSPAETAQLAEQVRQSLAVLKELKPTVKEAVAGCYADAARAAFVVQCVFAFGAVAAACWVRDKELK